MSCKIIKIENKFRQSNPELADKLNQLTLDTWNKVIDSNLFERKDDELYADQPGTDNRVKQEEVTSKINNPHLDLENKIVDGFLKDFNITTTEYQDLKEELNLNAVSAADLISKTIVYEKGQSILPEVAYFAYKMLGKSNDKVRRDLRYLVNKWDKYKERFAHHKNIVSKLEGFIEDKQEWKQKIRDLVILDFLQESIIEFNKDPKEFKKILSRKLTKDDFKKEEDYTLWEKIMDHIYDLIYIFKDANKAKLEDLKNIGYNIANEILNKDYNIYNYNLTEDQVIKSYEESIKSDAFAEELVNFGTKPLRIILTGSLALRKAGSVYRSLAETFHDIDWVIPFQKTATEDKEVLDNIKNIITKIGKEDNIETRINEELKNTQWYKAFQFKYGDRFKLINGFFGKEVVDWSSYTLQTVIDGEFYTNGEWIPGTGYVNDFFVRLNDHQEEHENYFKLWKEIMIAKIKMGRVKDFSDWKAFIPYYKSADKFNFYYKEFVHIHPKDIVQITEDNKVSVDVLRNEPIIQQVDANFSPAQLSDLLKPMYQRLLILNNGDRDKTNQELLFSNRVLFKPAYDNVGLYYLKSEDEPRFGSMNGSLENSLQGLLRDKQTIDNDNRTLYFEDKFIPEDLEYKGVTYNRKIDMINAMKEDGYYQKLFNKYKDSISNEDLFDFSIENEMYERELTSTNIKSIEDLEPFLHQNTKDLVNQSQAEVILGDVTAFVIHEGKHYISINIKDVEKIANDTGLPKVLILNAMYSHELYHSLSVNGIDNNKDFEKQILDLMKVVENQHDKNPFIDIMRGLFKGIPYAYNEGFSDNVKAKEFLAEAFSNPFYKEYLKNIPYKTKNIWQTILDSIKDLFGISYETESVYDKIEELYMSDAFRELSDKFEGTDTSEPIYFNSGDNKTNQIETAHSLIKKFLELNGLDGIFTTKIEDFIKSIRNVKSFQPKEKSIDNENIKSLLNSLDNKETVTDLGIMLSQMISVRSIFDSINKKTKSLAENATDNIDKIGILSTGLKQLEAFDDYIALCSSIQKEINKKVDLLGDVKLFQDNKSLKEGTDTNKQILRLLEAVAGGKQVIQEELNELSEDPIYDILFEQISDETKAKLKSYEDKVRDLKNKLTLPEYQNDKAQKELKRKIDNIESDIIPLIPSSAEWFKKELNGDYGNLSTFNKYLEAAQMSKSPTIQIISRMFKEVNLEVDRESLQDTNEIGRLTEEVINKTGNSNLDIEKFNAPIVTKLKVIEEIDEEGNILHSYERDALLNIYTPEYVEDYNKLKSLYTLWGEKLRLLRQENKDQYLINSTEKRYLEIQKEFEDFKEQNTERKYNKEFYEVEKIAKQDIHPDFPGVTLKKEKGLLYKEINDLQLHISTEKDNNIRQTQLDTLALLQIELKSVESLEGKKEGTKEYYLALKAIEHKEAKAKIGSYQLTPENEKFFNELLVFKQDQLDRKQITKEEFDVWKQMNVREVASQEWYEDNKLVREAINSTWESIVEIIKNDTEDNIFKKATFVTGVYKKDTEETYNKLRDIAKPYRDNNGIVNGSLIEKIEKSKNIDLTTEIKELDEYLEVLRSFASTLKGNTLDDRKSGTYSITDAKIAKDTRVRLGLDRHLDKLNNLFEELGELNDNSTTTYYNNRLDDEANILMDTITDEEVNENIRIEENDKVSYTINSTNYTYYKNKNVLTEYNTDNGETKTTKNSIYTTFESIVKKDLAYKKMNESEWFRANHYEKTVYNEETQSYTSKQEPIYIWRHTSPKDKTMLVEGPGYKYSSFLINEDVLNPNFNSFPDGLPQPKKNTKYINKEYVRLSTSDDEKDKAYFDYLEGLRKLHYKTQEKKPYNKRFGDALPSVIRSSEEKKVEFVKNLKDPSTFKAYAQDIYRTFKKDDAQELNNELDGIVSKDYVLRKEIPLLFTGKLESSKQSKNVTGIILMDSLSTLKYEKNIKLQPIVESTLALAKKAKKKDVKTTKENKLTKITNIIKGGENTDLAERLEKLIESELYGSRVDDAGIEIMGVDINKVLSKVMGATAFSSFAGNIFSPVKNTIGGKVQNFIEQNKKYGKYSEQNWINAEKQAMLETKALLSDYSKFGIQSKMSQILDYFQVIQGERVNKLGHKTQWNKAKNFTELLTSPKDFSEFQLQLTQFLAYADATFVETKNGKVKMLDAFDTNKKGDLIVKDVFTSEQKIVFEKKSKDFVFSLHHMNIALNGAYRLEERAVAQRGLVGRAAFFMNQYLMSGISRRYSNKRYYIAEDDVYSGFYTSSLKFLLKDTFNIKLKDGLSFDFDFNFKSRYENLTDAEKHNFSKFVREQAIIASVAILIMLTRGGDDDKDLSATQKLALAHLMGISMEAQTFSAFSGTDEMLRKIKNPFIFARTLGQVRNSAVYSVMSLYDEEAYYQKKSGSHEAGDSKAMANLMRLLSLSPSGIVTFDVDALYKQQKMFYGK